MTQLTPAWSIPYPDLTDTPNGAAQMQAMATKIDTLFSGADGRLTILETRTDLNGGEVKASASQPLNAAANKLTFATVVRTPTGITWNNADTWTIQEDGVYSAFCNLRTTATGSSGGLALGGTSYTDASLILPPSSITSVWGDYSLGGSVFLTAGTQVCFWFYLNSANTSTLFTTRPPMAKIWRVS